jgi:opacity protein-like surface antigen
MKKSLKLAVALLLFSTFDAFAQVDQPFIIGLNGGVNSVWIANQNIYGEPEVDYVSKMGAAVSLTLGYQFTEQVAVIAEIQSSKQGQTYEDVQKLNNIRYNLMRDIDLKYINIPVYFKYSMGEKSTKFRIMAGPQFGFLQEATQDFTRNGEVIGSKATNLDGETFVTDDADITDRFESMSISIAFDIGVDFHLSDRMYLSTGLKSNYSLADINATAYRITDFSGEYIASKNAWGGLFVGIHARL